MELFFFLLCLMVRWLTPTSQLKQPEPKLFASGFTDCKVEATAPGRTVYGAL